MGAFRQLARVFDRSPDDDSDPVASARPHSDLGELRRLTLRFNGAETVRLKTRRAGKLFSFVFSSAVDRTFLQRLGQWVHLLEHDDGLRASFERAWAEMLLELQSVSLFAESGLPRHSALSSETLRRLFQRLLPSAREENDAGRLIAEIFITQRSVERFVDHDGELAHRFLRLLSPERHPALLEQLRSDLRQSLCLLATRLAGRGATEAIRRRGAVRRVEDSPYYRMLFETQSLVEADSRDQLAAQRQRWERVVARCREELDQLHRQMEVSGVSSALVFDLRSIEASLDRMQLLADALLPDAGLSSAESGRTLLKTLVRARFEDTRISSLFHQNLNLLARKTVERTGHGGKHYIAHTHREYVAMWLAGAGGGLLTVFTAAIKMRVLEAHLPLFVEGLFISADYSISFLLLQIFGFALATKQPSMTAATLAGIIRDTHGSARNSKIAEFAADICRTQLAAAFSNVAMVCVGAVAFEAVWAHMFQTHYLPEASARHVYQTLHPFSSGTAIFAAVTGVLLWIAALVGGWCENFVVYHRIPDAILQHPLGQRLGARTLKRSAEWIERNTASWTTSISLGLLLGFTPVVARFFGIPLDVRHVTLSTGTLALAAARFGTSSFGHGWLYSASAGIGLTFVLNLGVSFAIASTVALRAYNVPWREQSQLIRYVLRDFLQSPLDFIIQAKPDVISITQPEPAVEEASLQEDSAA